MRPTSRSSHRQPGLPEVQQKVPLRAHLNVGYLYDGSKHLIDLSQYKPCKPATTGTDAQPPDPTTCDNLHLVLDYAYGIYPSRVRIGLGLDAPFALGKEMKLSPIFEYRVDVGVTKDPYFQSAPRRPAPRVTATPRPSPTT